MALKGKQVARARQNVLENSTECSGMQIHKLIMLHNNNFTIAREAVLSVIDEILWLLKDGNWHNLKEIIDKCSAPESKAKMAVSFLWEYDFIELNENRQKARLRTLALSFVDEIQRIEKEETSSHKSFEGTVGINKFASLRGSFEKV